MMKYVHVIKMNSSDQLQALKLIYRIHMNRYRVKGIQDMMVVVLRKRLSYSPEWGFLNYFYFYSLFLSQLMPSVSFDIDTLSYNVQVSITCTINNKVMRWEYLIIKINGSHIKVLLRFLQKEYYMFNIVLSIICTISCIKFKILFMLNFEHKLSYLWIKM